MREHNEETQELLPTICSSPEFLERFRIIVNENKNLIRPKTEEDPTRRGMRKFKHAIATFAA